jgi:5'-nucleotidase/UDP-sugar diphosphatase
MKRILATAALSVSALAMSAGASFADYTLNILHINDWHSRIESNNKFESTCSAEEEGKGECIGGAARLITAINQEREKLEGPERLLLNAATTSRVRCSTRPTRARPRASSSTR